MTIKKIRDGIMDVPFLDFTQYWKGRDRSVLFHIFSRPFLYAGLTLASFHGSGNILLSMFWLPILEMCGLITREAKLIIVVQVSSSPVAFF